MNTSFPVSSIIFLSFLCPSAFVGVPPLKYIQKYNSIFFESLQDSLTAPSPKCKIIRSFAGLWFCFGRFVSYLWYLFLVSVVSVFSCRSFRFVVWRVLEHAVFFRVKRQKAPATDGIKCKHENGLKLSITFLILYAYVKSLKCSPFKPKCGQFAD